MFMFDDKAGRGACGWFACALAAGRPSGSRSVLYGWGGARAARLQSTERRECACAIVCALGTKGGTCWGLLCAETASGALQDGKANPPRMLEEGGVILREKNDWWLFGKPKGFGGPLQRGIE